MQEWVRLMSFNSSPLSPRKVTPPTTGLFKRLPRLAKFRFISGFILSISSWIFLASFIFSTSTKSYAFNKFFFGTDSDLDLSYDIPEDVWNRIKFTHINLGYWNNYHNLQPINTKKDIETAAEAMNRCLQKLYNVSCA